MKDGTTGKPKEFEMTVKILSSVEMAKEVNLNPGFQPLVSLLIMCSCCCICLGKVVKDSCFNGSDDDFESIQVGQVDDDQS